MTQPLLFLLGLQRSGSTWLTNIFDAHRDTNVFMEPFAPTYGIFPEFPVSSYFLEESTPALDAMLRQQMPERLLRYKHLLLPDSGRSPRLFRAERALTNAILRGRAVLPERLWSRARKTQLLNLNRMDPHAPLVQKSAELPTWVIKELRLAGKIPVLRQAFPEARFVVLIRHPAANVHAISSWFKRGRLAELRRSLETFTAELAAQTVGEAYSTQLELCRRGSPEHVIALYWRISNEVMLRKLQNDPQALIITYEELATKPIETTSRLLAFAGLSPDQTTMDYVARSSTTSLAEGGRITTLRDSANHYRSWQTKISAPLLATVEDVTRGSPLLRLFERFYD